MNVLFQFGHPAHFHLYKNLITNLMKDGHQVLILIKKKDILDDLLKESGFPYVNILPNGRKSSMWGMIVGMVIRFWRVLIYAIKFHANILIGSCTEVAQVAWLLRLRSLVFVEDDAKIVPQFIRLVRPFVDAYLSPISCNNGKLEAHSIKYAGFHKLAYLHPNQFTPNKDIVEKYIPKNQPYFLLRFAQLKAYHDINIHAQGFSTDVAQCVIDKLSQYGKVYISSERELEPQFEQYRLNIDPLDIHHIMAFATLYLGDSQSMAVEAAMLGTPSIRFNDFAGKIGVLEELEHKYQLTYGIPSNNPQALYDKIDELLQMPNLRAEFQQRRERMLSEKIDVTEFVTWFVENYPKSKAIMKENPNYQYNFR